MEYSALLLEWFDHNHRAMPWRETRKAYNIWVSETMLQQTQVDTVIPYYNKFMERFPTVSTLAEAELEEVYTYWQGLGYYRRAANLHRGARLICEAFEGEFPRDPTEAKTIPGVGPYTLGAVLSIAYGIALPAVDGNVMRVLARAFRIDADIAVAKNRKIFEECVMRLMPSDPNRFNQSLMELGATVCTPKNPKCEICPVQSQCEGYKVGDATNYPIKTPKAKPVEERYHVCLIKKDGAIWLEKRDEDGLLAGMWGLPMICESEVHLYERVLNSSTILPEIKHVFTHKKWVMTPCCTTYCEALEEQLSLLQRGCSEGRYVTREEMADLPIATAFKKVIKKGIGL
ncbi:MAG: A/G-specific adenine glycosylase [Cellulosilyticaceae bacterium]